MLTIFRRLRITLLGEGQLRKYPVYAIGEILLVVIGILIALQINNWNENNQKDETLKVYLQNLSNDIRGDISTLDRLKRMSAFRYHSLQYVLKMAEAAPYNPAVDGMNAPEYIQDGSNWPDTMPSTYDRDFFQLAFLWSHRIGGYERNQSALNELSSTGLFSYIDNQDLKASVVDYQNTWDRRLRIVMRELVEDWQKSLESDGVITSDISEIENPISLVKNHPERITKIKRLLRESSYWVESAEVLIDMAEKLIAKIDEETAKL